MDDYKIYKSDLIINNKEKFVEICEDAGEIIKQALAHANYETVLGNSNKCPEENTKLTSPLSTTSAFPYYNIFCYLTLSDVFYDLYKELKQCIRDYVGDDRRIWFQAWLNILKYEEVEKVLAMHRHDYDVHGFISIDPKKTVTEFIMHEIENEVGNIYIGPCGKDYLHRVRNTDVWEGKRITIGFDCSFSPINPKKQNRFFPLL